MLQHNKNIQLASKILFFSLLVYFPVFLHLNSFPIIIWDEARLAINAQEMNANGNYLVTHFMGAPDLWSVKPPFMIWCQVLCLKILGNNALAIRIPSALAAVGTCLLILFFCYKEFKSYKAGIASVIVLITSHGYISFHGSRTGDYDTLLTFFMVLYSFSFYFYLQNTNTNKKYLTLFFVALTLAALTKGIAAFLPVPALIFYLFYKRKFVEMLKNKYIYIGSLACIAVIFGYYFLREYVSPGYIKAVLQDEILGRYFSPMKLHEHPFPFYWEGLINHRFPYWIFFLAPAFVINIFNRALRPAAIFLTTHALFYFFIVSLAQTKLEWYDIPLFPMLSLIIGLALYRVFNFITQKLSNTNYKISIIAGYLFLIFVFLYPYIEIVNKNTASQRYLDMGFYNIGFYLKDVLKGKQQTNANVLCYEGYYAHNYFYLNALREKGTDIKLKHSRELQKGDIVLINQYELKEYVHNNYTVKLLNEWKGVETLLVE